MIKFIKRKREEYKEYKELLEKGLTKKYSFWFDRYYLELVFKDFINKTFRSMRNNKKVIFCDFHYNNIQIDKLKNINLKKYIVVIRKSHAKFDIIIIGTFDDFVLADDLIWDVVFNEHEINTFVCKKNKKGKFERMTDMY